VLFKKHNRASRIKYLKRRHGYQFTTLNKNCVLKLTGCSYWFPKTKLMCFKYLFCAVKQFQYQSQCPRGLRCRDAAGRLMRWWVQIHRWDGVLYCDCYVLSGRGLCDELITRPEGSYQIWCFVMCDLQTSGIRIY
jgi:hypothetical protein